MTRHEHYRECNQHPDNEQHYPCECARIDADLAEHVAELEFDRQHEEGLA